jgi:hypothetical protein
MKVYKCKKCGSHHITVDCPEKNYQFRVLSEIVKANKLKEARK